MLLSKCGESNLRLSHIKDCVVVCHECVSQDPELGSNAGVGDDGSNAAVRALRGGTKVESRSHGELFTSKGEGDFWNGGRAWEGVEARAEGRVLFGSRDLGVECLDAGGVSDDKGGSL